MANGKQSWDKVGIEFEYTDIVGKNDALILFARENGFIFTHDASVESPASGFMSAPIKGSTFSAEINQDLLRRIVIGGELVSPILSTKDRQWVGLFDRLFGIMKNLGERTSTSRGSIHIHINFPIRETDSGELIITPIKKAWVLAGYTESFFYRIGCMGRSHRGDNFDFIYCRPITGNGPPIIRKEDGILCPLLIYEDVLNSKTYYEFMVRCGDILNAESRYHPSRYFWINFYNLCHYPGTTPHLEFRVFNKTMRIDYLYAIVELCKAFVRTSQKSKDSDVFKEICGINSEIPDSNTYFNSVTEILGLESDAKRILKRIWDISQFPYFDNALTWSHLEGRNVFWNREYRHWWPKSLDPDKYKEVVNPNFTDIHKLEREKIEIFPEEDQCAN
jgi:hypothetical protein